MDQLTKNNTGKVIQEKVHAKNYWELIWNQFKKHYLAIFGLLILILFYSIGVFFPEFFDPYKKMQRFENEFVPPTKIRFVD